MSSKLSDLDHESLLVLYVAGELTDGDKLAFERHLAANPQLAGELTRLREAQVVCVDALRSADEQIRLPVSEGVAARRVARAMAQWQLDRARLAPANGGKNWRIAWWAYPAAAAAIFIVGFLIWSSRQPIALPNQDSIADKTDVDDQSDPADALADWMDTSFGVTAEANAGAAVGVDAESALSLPLALPGSDDAGTSIFPVLLEETIQ